MLKFVTIIMVLCWSYMYSMYWCVGLESYKVLPTIHHKIFSVRQTSVMEKGKSPLPPRQNASYTLFHLRFLNIRANL